MHEVLHGSQWGQDADGDHGTQDRAPECTNPTIMKHRILRGAAACHIPVMLSKISGGVLVWRSTDENRQHATEVSQRL
jgi:hypothetical protein